MASDRLRLPRIPQLDTPQSPSQEHTVQVLDSSRHHPPTWTRVSSSASSGSSESQSPKENPAYNHPAHGPPRPQRSPESSRTAHESSNRGQNKPKSYTSREERPPDSPISTSQQHFLSWQHNSAPTAHALPPSSYSQHRARPESTQPYTYPAPLHHVHDQRAVQTNAQGPPPPPLPSNLSPPENAPTVSAPAQPMSYTHTALVPTVLDVAPTIPHPREKAMEEIIKHSNTLYAFASRYADLKQSIPSIQPPREELASMTKLANLVVTLLDNIRQQDGAGKAKNLKRPWDETAGEGYQGPTTPAHDMEIIRSRRAATIAVAIAPPGTNAPAEPKPRYKKRTAGVRANPPGKCHSCNIRETPEWRRGPDGARTLCNACGIYYAKLQRQRERAGGAAAAVDIETLRAAGRPSTGKEKKTPATKRAKTGDGASPSAQPEDLVAPPLPPPTTYIYYQPKSP